MKNISKKLADKAVQRMDSAQEKPGLFETMGEIFNPDYSDMIIRVNRPLSRR